MIIYMYGIFPNSQGNVWRIRRMISDWDMDDQCAPNESVWVVPGTWNED